MTTRADIDRIRAASGKRRKQVEALAERFCEALSLCSTDAMKARTAEAFARSLSEIKGKAPGERHPGPASKEERAHGEDALG